MHYATHFWLASFLAVLPAASTAASKYTWFDDTSVSKSASPVDMEVYRSATEADASAIAESKISLFGDYSPRTADEGDSDARRFVNFGVRWQHRVSSQDSVSVSARHGESTLAHPAVTTNPDALDTRATISWTRELSWALKPSITGGVFLGDETPRDEMLRNSIGRRYYGFTIGGELRLLQSHTPYVSFRMQRSLYDMADDSNTTWVIRGTEDTSRFAAGWRWQATRGLSLQAEASYGFSFNNNGSEQPLLQERDRSRVFFGTRFDFR